MIDMRCEYMQKKTKNGVRFLINKKSQQEWHRIGNDQNQK